MITFDDAELRQDGKVVLSGLSGMIDGGSLTALTGPNGSGKTTLFRAIAGLHPPSMPPRPGFYCRSSTNGTHKAAP